jgi:Tfp pilus assembly protein PilX
MFLSKIRKIADRISASQSGSALILTMFIMSGMLIVAFSGAYVVLLGIKSGGIQAQSTKAYYAAEAGTERVLWEVRKHHCQPSEPSCTGTVSDQVSVFQDDGTLSTVDLKYYVYFTEYPPLVFRSIGEYKNTRRSVEVRM